MLSNNVKLLGQMIGNILLPVVAKILPYLNAFVIVLQRLFSWLAKILGIDLSGLMGKNQGYDNSNLSDMLDDAENLSDALDDDTDSAKKLKKQLQGFDALNNLTTNDNNNKAGNSALASGLLNDAFLDAVQDYLDAWDKAFKELENKAQKMADKIQAFFIRLTKPIVKAWEKVGEYVKDAWYRAGKSLKLTFQHIAEDFWRVWEQPETVQIFEHIFSIFGKMGELVFKLSNRFREAWDYNENGYRILKGIRDIILKITERADKMSDSILKWAEKIDLRPLMGKIAEFIEAFNPVVEHLGEILQDFLDEFLLPLAKWTLEDGLPKLLQVLIDLKDKIDWEKLKANLKKLWEHLEPFAERIGEGLIQFIEDITDKIADFINGDNFTKFLEKFEEWMDSVSADDITRFLEALANGIILLKGALVGFSAIKGITGTIGVLKDFFAIFGIGVGGAGVAGTATGLAETAGAIDGVTGAVTGLTTAMGGLATVVGGGIAWSFMDDKVFDAMEKLGADADQVEKMREKYDGLGSSVKLLKDGFTLLKEGHWNVGIEGLTSSADALSHAMRNVSAGFVYTTSDIEDMAKQFNWTEEDVDSLIQHINDLSEASDKYEAHVSNLQKIHGGGGHERTGSRTESFIRSELLKNKLDSTALEQSGRDYGKRFSESFNKGFEENTRTSPLPAKSINLDSITASVSNKIEEAKTAMATGGVAIATSFATGFLSNIGSPLGALGNLNEGVTAEYHKIEEKSYNAGNTIAVKMANGVQSGESATLSKVKSLTSRISDAFTNLPSIMQSKGANLMSGLLAGITSYVSRITSTVRSVANTITGVFSRTWRIHSPSLVMNEMGMYFMEGLQNGIESMYTPIENSLGQFSNDLISAPMVEGVGDMADIGNVSASQTFNADSTETNALLRTQNALLQAILEKETGISAGDIFNSVKSSADAYYRMNGKYAFT